MSGAASRNCGSSNVNSTNLHIFPPDRGQAQAPSVGRSMNELKKLLMMRDKLSTTRSILSDLIAEADEKIAALDRRRKPPTRVSLVVERTGEWRRNA